MNRYLVLKASKPTPALRFSEGKKRARATFTSSPAAASSRSAWRMSARFCSSCEGTPTLSACRFRSM